MIDLIYGLRRAKRPCANTQSIDVSAYLVLARSLRPRWLCSRASRDETVYGLRYGSMYTSISIMSLAGI